MTEESLSVSNPTERSALAAWERSTEVPLLLLAIAFLAAWAWPVIDRGLSRDVRSYLGSVSWTVWGAFACDFAVRLTLAGEQRAAYARKHWYDIALICLPLLRPLRLLRLITLLRVIDRAGSSRANRALTYVLGASVLAVTVGAIAVLDAEERNPGANIKTIGDALWWACTTVTTVGYGDRYPVTATGRCVAVVLMFVGIALMGTVTAALAAWFMARSDAETKSASAHLDTSSNPQSGSR